MVEKNSEALQNPYDRQILKKYYNGGILSISDDEFESLLGHPLPSPNWDKTKPLHRHSVLWQGKYKKGFGKFLYNLVSVISKLCFFFGKPIAGNNVMFAMYLPFKSMSRLTSGAISDAMVDNLLVMVNGYFFRGFGGFIKSAFKKNNKI